MAIELLARAYAEGDESLTKLVASWQERLREAQDRYRDDDERHATLGACFEYSYGMLPPEAKDLFEKLTIFTAPFQADTVKIVFSLEEVREFLNLLFRKSLLQRHEVVGGLSFYFFHPIARWYAEEKIKGADLGSLEKAMALAYLDIARNIYDKLTPLSSLAARILLPDMERALKFLPDRERRLLAFYLGWLLRIFGELDQAMRLYQESQRLYERLGDLGGKAATLHEMARIYERRGDIERAIELYQDALDIKERLKDLRGKAATLHEIANFHRRSQPEQAMALYQETLHIYEQLGDLQGMGATLNGVASIHQRRGELERAMELYQEILRIAEQLEDLQGKGVALHEIAEIRRVRGEIERAMELYGEALRIEEQLGDLHSKGVTLAMRGQLLAEVGKKELALKDFVEAIDTLISISAPDAEQVGKMIRGLMAQVSDEDFDALWRKVTGQQEAPEWLAEPRKAKLDRLLALAARHEAEKHWQAAVKTYGEALALLDSWQLSAKDQRRYAETVLRLGGSLRLDGQWGPAVERLQEAFRLFKPLKDFRGQGLAYLEIARAYQAMNSYDLAMLYCKDASRLFKWAGDVAMAGAAHEEAGNLQVYLRAFSGAVADLEEAARLYEEAARLYTEAKIPSRVAIVEQNMDLARQSQG